MCHESRDDAAVLRSIEPNKIVLTAVNGEEPARLAYKKEDGPGAVLYFTSEPAQEFVTFLWAVLTTRPTNMAATFYPGIATWVDVRYLENGEVLVELEPWRSADNQRVLLTEQELHDLFLEAAGMFGMSDALQRLVDDHTLALQIADGNVQFTPTISGVDAAMYYKKDDRLIRIPFLDGDQAYFAGWLATYVERGSGDYDSFSVTFTTWVSAEWQSNDTLELGLEPEDGGDHLDLVLTKEQAADVARRAVETFGRIDPVEDGEEEEDDDPQDECDCICC